MANKWKDAARRAWRLGAWAGQGLTEADIAAREGVTVRTLRGWARQKPEAAGALAEGRDAYLKVEEALYKLATGYVVPVTKHFKETVREYDPATGKKTRETETAVPRVDEVYVQPSVTAAQYWLSNYRPEEWGRETPEGERLLRAVDALLDAVEREIEGEWMPSPQG